MHRIVFKEVEKTDEGLLIRKIDIIDASTGEVTKEAEMNDALIDLITHVEVNLKDYYIIQRLKKENPNFKKLINSFNLCS